MKGRSNATKTRGKTRPESHRRWRCPGKNCGNIFVNPIPITGVWCNDSEKHSKRTPVIAMRPDEVDGS